MKQFLTKILSQLKVKPVYLIILAVALLILGVVLGLRLSSKPDLTFSANTTIVPTKGVYAFKNTTNEFQTQFKAKLTDLDSIVFKNDLGKISFYTPAGQSFGDINSSNSPVADGSTLTYPEIFPQIDLRYTISSSRLLEEFIVKDATTAGLISRIEQKATTKSTYVQNDDGSISFYEKNKVAFTLPHPVMYETGDPSQISSGIVYEIKKDNGEFIITKVITDEGKAWLADPKRIYPIAIDLVIDNGDTSSNWVSSDPTATTVSQETTIKQEGTGSVKVQTAAVSAPVNVDLMEYASDGTAQAGYVTGGDAFSATGGTITTSGNDKIHTFTSSGTFTITSGSGNATILVVGSGGNGGSANDPLTGGAGGGGGGAASESTHTLATQAYAVTVGGGTSSFGSLVSRVSGVSPGNSEYGGTGGSPGGGNGGSMGNPGSNGITSTISGASVCYSGGGGGGSGSVGASGGCGGASGGQGQYVNGSSASPNTGGGGGGAGRDAGGGGGGSGIVIVRYLTTPALQSYSEATIKTQGTYALKGVAQITISLNKTLTRTIATPLNLSDKSSVTFYIRASRTGSNIKVGLHDVGGITTEVTPNIASVDTFQTATIDLSAVTNANKDAIDQIIITVINADATNTFYLDNMVATAPSSLNDTVTRTIAATNLSIVANITYWVRSSVAGSYATFGFSEPAVAEQSTTITINQANTWEQKSWNIEGITGTARDAVTKFSFTFTGDTSGAIFYFDDIQTNNLFAPTLGTATGLSETSIRWNFTDNSTEETGFKIYDSAGTTVLVTCATANLTYCDETGLTPNTQYTRKIGTYNASSASITSGTVSGYTILLSGDFICTQGTVSSITLTDRYVDGSNLARYVIGLDRGSAATNTAVFEARSCIMTLNSTDTLVVGSLSITGGSIAIADGGIIKIKQPVWIIDADGDGYSSDGKLYYGTQPAGGRRKNLAITITTTDCNDSSYNLANSCCTIATRYRDADGDTYGNPSVSISACTTVGYVDNNTDCNDASASLYRSVAGYLDSDADGYGAGAYTTCVDASGSYVASGADCYDGNASAYPGSGACSATNRGDGSYDYNCSGGASACGTSRNYSYAGQVGVFAATNDGDPDNNNSECSPRNAACAPGGYWNVYVPASIGCGGAGYAGCAGFSTGVTGCNYEPGGCAYPSTSTVCSSPGAYGTQACQ